MAQLDVNLNAALYAVSLANDPLLVWSERLLIQNSVSFC